MIFFYLKKKITGKKIAFKNWTINNVVAHLCFGDYLAITSSRGSQEFLSLMAEVNESKLSLVEFTRQWLKNTAGLNTLSLWRGQFVEMCALFEASDSSRRLMWAGPEMGIKMFVTARLMETWAHSWSIYDALGLSRNQSDRIRHIVTIGAKTFGWTFANRDLDPPGQAPHLALTSPSGDIWQWHTVQPDNCIVGDAVEFCQVVTQVRNIADTSLRVTGEVAISWMAIAQCFAGPPEEPPAPGSRFMSG